MPQNPLTLTRQSLYELVRSKPMVGLSKEFDISDVGFAKRCRAVDLLGAEGRWPGSTAHPSAQVSPYSAKRGDPRRR